MRVKQLAFTLVELLTVIAISAILITLIIVPLIQGFNLTRQGQAIAEAQDRARLISDRIAVEIGNAAGVRDNTGYKGSITVVVPGKLVGTVQPDVPVTLPYGKLDIINPASGDPTRGPSGAYINPITGKEDPSMTAPMGQVVLPVAPGATITRYFTALREPIDGTGNAGRYNNPYEGILMAKDSKRDNLFSLYRAQAQVYIQTDSGPVVNAALFADANMDNVPDDIDDPAFFALLPTTDYNPTTRALTAAGVEKAKRIRNWLGQGTQTLTVPDPTDPTHVATVTIKCPLGQANIISDLQRYDMIQPIFDLRTRQVIYDNTTDYVEQNPPLKDRPRIIALAQFKPTRISSDPAEGQQAVRLGEEAENATDIAPDVFTTKYGGWTSSVIRTWPYTWVQSDPANNEYLVGRDDPRNGQAGIAPGFAIYWFDPDSGGEETLNGTELFDVQAYEQGVATGSMPYTFSLAVQQADHRSNWLTDTNVAKMRADFTPYFPDKARGKLVGSFAITEIGALDVSDPLNPVAIPPPPSDPNNLPQADTGAALSPLQDPGTGEVYSPTVGNYHINGSFNNAWNSHPELRPDIQRFIDLRVASQGDGTPSPLDPDPTIGYARARIVPGSEEVYGPDQNPGVNFGRMVRYTRTLENPGPDQYKINYVDLTEPDYSVAFPSLTTPLPNYIGSDFTTAVIQPRFKAGYIQLNSDSNDPIPTGTFQIFYKFQFTHPNDAFAVDYDSRQVMSINLTIRSFPQSSFPNATGVSVKTSATVRNFIK